MTHRVAVLIDGDNLNAGHFSEIKSQAATMGRLDIVRVYAGNSRANNWQATLGARLVYAGQGKNAADILLSIDAMEIACLDGVESFAIASSDKDFTHLAQRLREKGRYVLGLGEEKTTDCFRESCHRFHELGDSRSFDEKIKDVIAEYSEHGQGITLKLLSSSMSKKYGTKISSYPERTWRKYLQNRTTQYAIDMSGEDTKVRFLPEGFH